MQREIAGRKGALVEDEEALENLEILLVEYSAPDTVVKLPIRERSLGLEALI
jgi:hypothetical protein